MRMFVTGCSWPPWRDTLGAGPIHLRLGLFGFLLARAFFNNHAENEKAYTPVDPRPQNQTFPERGKIHLSLCLFAFLMKRDFFKTHAQIKEAYTPVDPCRRNAALLERGKSTCPYISFVLFVIFGTAIPRTTRSPLVVLPAPPPALALQGR